MNAHLCKLGILVAGLMATQPGTAGGDGPAYLVADLRESAGPSRFHPDLYDTLHGRLYFSGRTAATGAELFRTDGTPEGTELMADLCGGACDSLGLYSDSAAVFGGELYFPACDTPGCRLFKTDGDVVVPVAEGQVYDVVAWDGALFYGTRDGEVRRTDGQGPGTLVYRMDELAPLAFLPADGALFILAGEPCPCVPGPPRAERFQLWSTDGTEERTVLIRDSFSPFELFPVFFEDRVVFRDEDQLWLADPFGAEPLLEKSPFTRPEALHAASGVLFVRSEGRQLWRTDGTPEGTVLLDEAGVEGDDVELRSALYEEELYFVHGRESRVLYRTSDLAGKTPFYEFPAAISSLDVLAGTLYVGTGQPTSTLWKTSGTVESTSEVVALTEGWFELLGELDAALLLTRRQPGGASELLRVAAGGGELEVLGWRETGLSSDPEQLARHRDGVLFKTALGEVWRSDGTSPGTVRVPGDFSSSEVFRAGRVAFIRSSDTLRTVDESGMLVDVFELPGGETFARHPPVVLEKVVLILTVDLFGRVDLWRIDRESGEAVLVMEEIHRLKTFNSPEAFQSTRFRAVVLLLENTAWWTDGTRERTRQIFDVTEVCDCLLSEPTDAGPVYFTSLERPGARTGPATPRLWRTIAEETVLVRSFPPDEEGRETSVYGLTGAASKLFYFVSKPRAGVELWATDTVAGPVLLRSFQPDGAPGGPDRGKEVFGRLVFVADDGVHGRELWRSDGTPEGTELLRDLLPGPRSSDPRELRIVHRRLVFAADDGVHGVELWGSDGTEEGTRLVQDLEPGILPSDPRSFTLSGSLVFFNARTEEAGAELWAVPGDAVLEPLEARFSVSAIPIERKPVAFTDISVGRPMIRCWTFGDEPPGAPGCSSRSQTVYHAFAEPGTYQVTLRVTRLLPFGVEQSSDATIEVSVNEVRPPASPSTMEPPG